jgi:Fe-S cluster assembly protein SufD
MAVPLLDALLGNETAPDSQLAWLSNVRRAAREALLRDGMPPARSESWKYTPLRALEQRRFETDADSASEIDMQWIDLPGVAGPRLVFVNGMFRADLSRVPSIDGLHLQALSQALQNDPESLREFLAASYDDSAEVFARLNSALAVDGPVVRVDAGVKVDTPVHLVYVSAGSQTEIAWHARSIIDIARDASLRIVDHYVSAPGQSHLGNLLCQVRVADRAQLDCLQLQNSAESALLVRRSEIAADADAHVNLRTIEAGAQWMRHDLGVRLHGDRAAFVSRGVFALRGRQHADTRLDVRHLARDTSCDLVWRGVADQRARGVFHGAITVAVGADGTDASLSNKNLLLSEQAEIDTQPVLEIHADEVKAAHGATVGQLDERAMFYLQSRGLPADEARSLLTLAFCRVAVDSIENVALREHIDALLLERLPNAFETK